jgi:hypothetical protein
MWCNACCQCCTSEPVSLHYQLLACWFGANACVALSPLQPALYEAFGLTVVEAMTCGLPTFATCNGGPSEIIKNGKSGFHIDPYHGDAVSDGQQIMFQRRHEEQSSTSVASGMLVMVMLPRLGVIGIRPWAQQLLW